MEEREEMLLTSREAAEILDLSPDTVNEFARKQVLPAVKKGRQWRFRRRDIASFKRHLNKALGSGSFGQAQDRLVPHLSKASDSGLRPQQRGKAAA